MRYIVPCLQPYSGFVLNKECFMQVLIVLPTQKNTMVMFLMTFLLCCENVIRLDAYDDPFRHQ